MCQGLFGTCLFGRRDISTHAGRQQEGGRREGEEREGRELEREGGQGRQGTLDSKHLIQNNMQETVLPLLAPRRRATAVGWRTIAPVMTHRVSRPCRRRGPLRCACKGGQLSEGQRGIGSVGHVVGTVA